MVYVLVGVVYPVGGCTAPREVLMPRGNRPVWICGVCGHVWLMLDEQEAPKRCASNKCRTRKWNEGDVTTFHAQASGQAPVSPTEALAGKAVPEVKPKFTFQRGSERFVEVGGKKYRVDEL